jgi:hypothetical protein
VNRRQKETDRSFKALREGAVPCVHGGLVGYEPITANHINPHPALNPVGAIADIMSLSGKP